MSKSQEEILKHLEMFAEENTNRQTPELDKLQIYLEKHNIPFVRIDKEPTARHQCDWHQIIVYNKGRLRLWDAICHYGSYGYKEGLLEIYGVLCVDVEGCLTAEEVIKKWEAYNE